VVESSVVCLTKSLSAVSQRPSRKAKTKEAVLKHLNRDVEMLVEEKTEKKSSTKKEKIANAANAAYNANKEGSKYIYQQKI